MEKATTIKLVSIGLWMLAEMGANRWNLSQRNFIWRETYCEFVFWSIHTIRDSYDLQYKFQKDKNCGQTRKKNISETRINSKQIFATWIISFIFCRRINLDGSVKHNKNWMLTAPSNVVHIVERTYYYVLNGWGKKPNINHACWTVHGRIF